MTYKFLVILIIICQTLLAIESSGKAQEQDHVNVMSVMDSLSADAEVPATTDNWWIHDATQSQRSGVQQKTVSLQDLLMLALQHSAQIKVYSEVPLIRETAVEEAIAAFDWTTFAESLWEDTDEPVGSALTVGGAGTRFKDHNINASAGIRRRTLTGGELEFSQRIGHQNNNSNFFVPNNQGMAQLRVGFTQSLMRGRGASYNSSLTVLASLDVETARQEFLRQLQSHLLEVARGYWALYLERASLAQKVRLYLKTKSILSELEHRQNIDAALSQIVSTKAALENRRADLVRAQAAVKNAETRLRALINAPELGTAETVELIPGESPIFDKIQVSEASEIATAVQNRPEVVAAMKEIKAGCVRLDMAKNEMLPLLNLVTQFYVSGLQGESDIPQAWVDQFSVGAPSYSIGLNYEIPIGNRAASARLNRRRIEARQLQEQYRSALETVNAEVDVAVRELRTAYGELNAKQRALAAAETDSETIQGRWQRVANGQGSSSLTLDSLLRAQERVTQTENELLTAQLTYNLAIVNLKRVNGTLLQAENVTIDQVYDGSLPEILMGSGGESSIMPGTSHEPTIEVNETLQKNTIRERSNDFIPASARRPVSSRPVEGSNNNFGYPLFSDPGDDGKPLQRNQ